MPGNFKGQILPRQLLVPVSWDVERIKPEDLSQGDGRGGNTSIQPSYPAEGTCPGDKGLQAQTWLSPYPKHTGLRTRKLKPQGPSEVILCNLFNTLLLLPLLEGEQEGHAGTQWELSPGHLFTVSQFSMSTLSESKDPFHPVYSESVSSPSLRSPIHRSPGLIASHRFALSLGLLLKKEAGFLSLPRRALS